ncbi:ATP-binding cassette domain-containing protein [Rhodobacterales bacterium HKCCE2091]|nr:ATP-binding cassette domain-containing protein [Rhodobacterales bacterium HKCCE2091]
MPPRGPARHRRGIAKPLGCVLRPDLVTDLTEALPGSAATPDAARDARRRARRRILDPVAGPLRIAAALSLASGVLWPVQAAAIAWAVSGWASGADPLRRAGIAAAVLVVAGLVRALLDRAAAARLHDAADRTIARERALIAAREARAPGGRGSAAIAALSVQKLPLLQPWITRYHVAAVRVAVLPAVFLLLSFSISWVVGLTLLVAGPLIPVFMALVGMAAEDASRRQLDEIGTMNEMLMERLSALLDIRALGASDRVAEAFETRAERLRERTMAVLRIAFLSSTVLELFAAIGVALVAVFVGFTLLGEIGFGTWSPPLTLGQGLFLLLIAPEFFQPLRDLAAAWHDRAAGLAVVAELDALDAVPRAGLVGTAAPAAPLAGDLAVSVHGGVAALPGRMVALPDLSLAAGGTLALTGPSGVGKTTALMALAGLVPLSRGRIEVCGRGLGPDTADAWRARIAFLPQRPHFPDTTLADWLDPRGTGADPASALRRAHAEGIVARLPDGLETRLGEAGGGVSGGEARRLMIARAIMAGGDLVLADEPTADLDDETAARVTEGLLSLVREGRALIVATHDPALAAAMSRRIALT